MYEVVEVVQRIKDLARQKGIKTSDMLIACELSKNALSSMSSRGSWIQANSLAKIADHLNVSVDYLLGRTDLVDETSSKTKDIDDNNTQNFDKETIEIAEMIKNLSLVERSKVIVYIDEIKQTRKIEQKTYKIPTAARRGINGNHFFGNTEDMTEDEINNILNAEDGDENL